MWAVATAQEEENLGGAATSAFHLHPDLAIVLDVTFAKGAGDKGSGGETFPLGKGPALGGRANLHPYLYKKFKELADQMEIPVAMDISPSHSGTDAYAIQVAREGIPTMVIGIPLRYMHTPVEVVAVKDIQRTGRLLAEFISRLELDFVSRISWRTKMANKAPAVGAAQIKLLEKLCRASGVSGGESEVRKIILDEIKPHVDEVKVDALGDVLAFKKGRGAKRLRLMLDAHMDEVGFIWSRMTAKACIVSKPSEALIDATWQVSRFWLAGNGTRCDWPRTHSPDNCR